MYKVIYKETRVEFDSLKEALAHATTLKEFVTISGSGFEVVGKFGVDSIVNGVCPDGVKYDWDKSARIGRVKRERS